MSATLDFAEVRSFTAGGDVAGLLEWMRPDALVVDDQAAADAATPYALEHDLPLIHISVRSQTLHLFRGGEWEQVSNGDGPTPDALRNVVAGALFARGGPVR